MTHVVQFIADYLRVASIVVSAGHCPLERPEQGVVDLQETGRVSVHGDTCRAPWSHRGQFVPSSQTLKHAGSQLPSLMETVLLHILLQTF